jgi:HSP20 family protein
MFEDMTKNISNDLVREKKLSNRGAIKVWSPFLYGYSMTMGPNGKPIIREFGNVKPSTKHTPVGYHNPTLQSTEGREPLADVFEDDTSIRIIAEVL